MYCFKLWFSLDICPGVGLQGQMVGLFLAFFFFWLRWVFVAACGLSLVAASGGLSCGAQALGTRASVVVAHRLSSCGTWALECRLSSCGAWAYLLCGTWDLPGSGIEPVSPAFAGRFLTTAPPGKSLFFVF